MKENVRIELEDDLLWKFRAIKKNLGIDAGAEVIRYLITEKYATLEREGKTQPRYSHFNVYEDHVEVRDNLDNTLWDVYFRNGALYCQKDESKVCPHVDYARTLDKVREIMAKK